jgi:branched-chain amino acid transport system permease protein
MKRSERLKPYIPWITIIAVVILLAVIAPSPYIMGTMVFVALWGGLAIGMGVLMGQAGLFSLAQPTWFGLGAYCAGILAVRGILPPWAGIIAGGVLVALISFIIGIPVLRLRGMYLACVTLGILMIAQIAFVHLIDLTGGSFGLKGIPPLTIGGFVFQNDLHYYFLSWALCIWCLWFFSNIMNSRVGRAIKALRDSEVASKAMGINIPMYRLQIFVLTSVTSALAGGIFCFYLRFIAPTLFSFDLLIELVLMIVIGGIGSLWGLLLGSFVFTWLSEGIHLSFGKIFPTMTGSVDSILFAILVIVILIFMPNGLVGWVEQLFRLGRGSYEHLRSSLGQ